MRPRPLNIYYCSAWADNADVISLQYAGTSALKTDYTRFVKKIHMKINLFFSTII